MVETAKEAIGSMGDDTPLAVISDKPRLISQFFRQNFSQVTNPPIDPLRERHVMSLKTRFGNLANILDAADRGSAVLVLDSPVLTNTDWLRLKAALSVDLLREWRAALTAYGGEGQKLSANAFMPPYTLFTGFDFAGAAEFCSAASPKLYTMHWSAMVEFWGRVLMERNEGLDERLVVRALAHLFDLGDAIDAEGLSDYGYPAPDEPHPVPDGCQLRKIAQVRAAAGPEMAITPLVHGYGPVNDVVRRSPRGIRARWDQAPLIF